MHSTGTRAACVSPNAQPQSHQMRLATMIALIALRFMVVVYWVYGAVVIDRILVLRVFSRSASIADF